MNSAILTSNKELVELAQEKVSKQANRLGERNQYWINGGVDEGLSYCFECVKKEVRELKRKGAVDVRVDGGWDIGESDIVESCQRCDKLLTYSLTRYGCDTEVEHFLDSRIEVNLRSPLFCYEAEQVLDWHVGDNHNKQCIERNNQIVLFAKKILGILG